MLLISTIVMRIRIHITIVLSLMAIVIVACVGISTGLPRNYQAYGSPDWDVPWSPGRHYSSERRDQKEWRDVPISEPRNTPDPRILFQKLDDLERMGDGPTIPGKIPAPTWVKKWNQPGGYPVEPIVNSDLALGDTYSHIPIEGTGQEFLDTSDYLGLGNMNEKSNENSAGLRDSNRKMGFYWDKDRDEASRLKDQYCLVWPDSPSYPVYNPLTSGSRSSTFCLDYPPSRPDTTKQSDPTKTPTKSPHTSKPTHSRVKPSKCRKKSRLLNPETAKVVLEIIMDTKQHVLSTLKILNYMEYEVLGHSPDDCPLQDLERDSALRLKGRPAPKKMPERVEKPLKSPTWKQSQDFSFGNRLTSQRKSASALAREEKFKQNERVWEEHQEPTPARGLTIKSKSRKHRKEQPKMKRLPPGMVAILC